MNNITKASYLLSERNRYLLEVVAMFKKEHRYPGRDANPGELDQAAAQFNARHREEISLKLEKAEQYEKAFVAEASPEELAQADIIFRTNLRQELEQPCLPN